MTGLKAVSEYACYQWWILWLCFIVDVGGKGPLRLWWSVPAERGQSRGHDGVEVEVDGRGSWVVMECAC